MRRRPDPLALALLVAAGCGPGWTVVRQGSRGFSASTQLAVETSTWNKVHVGKKTEAEHLAKLEEADQERWQNDKLGFSSGFQAGLIEQRGGLDVGGTDQLAGRWVVHTNVEHVEPGIYDGLINAPTEMRTRVVITDPDQAPLDEIEIRCRVVADLYRPTLAMRLQECGRITGYHAAKYLRQRAGLD